MCSFNHKGEHKALSPGSFANGVHEAKSSAGACDRRFRYNSRERGVAIQIIILSGTQLSLLYFPAKV